MLDSTGFDDKIVYTAGAACSAASAIALEGKRPTIGTMSIGIPNIGPFHCRALELKATQVHQTPLPFQFVACYRSPMLKYQIKRRDAEREKAVAEIVDIEASIVALNNDDLLDLADIFQHAANTRLREMTTTEMAKRNLRL